MRKRNLKAMALLFFVAGCLAGVVEAADPEPVPPKMLARFDIPKDGQMILLPVELGGKTFQFMLDTGSSFNTFDEALRPLLGEPRQTERQQGNDGKMHNLNIYYAPDAKLGDLSFRTGGAVLCVDLSELRQLTGQDIRGIVGIGLVRRYALQIDCAAGVLTIFKSGDESAAPADWGQPVEMLRAQQGSPVVAGRLYDKYQAPFMIDTGYPDTGMIIDKLFDLLQKEKFFTDVAEIPIETTTGSAVGVSARVDGFAIGKIEYKNMIFDKSPGASVLGMGFVHRQKITLDFPNLKVYIQPGDLLNSVDQNDMSGLHLLKQDNGVVIHSVDKDSPAAGAGLKKADVLYQINGQHVSKISLWKVRKILSNKPGDKIEVVFQRGKKFFKTAFVLKEQL